MSDEHDPPPPPAPTDAAPLPGPHELITIADAARLSGLAPATLREAAMSGRLRVQIMTPRMNLTTRRWLHDYLQARGGTAGMGRPPKPLPPGYQAPGPGRPRKPAVRKTATDTPQAEESQP